MVTRLLQVEAKRRTGKDKDKRCTTCHATIIAIAFVVSHAAKCDNEIFGRRYKQNFVTGKSGFAIMTARVVSVLQSDVGEIYRCRGYNVRRSAKSAAPQDLHERADSLQSQRRRRDGSDVEIWWETYRICGLVFHCCRLTRV